MQIIKWITLGVGALCLIIVATSMKAPQLYYMAAILMTLPGISYLLGWYALHGLEFSREIPHLAWEGEEGQLNYIINNPTRVTRFFLTIHEFLPDWATYTHTKAPLFNVSANDEVRVTHSVRFLRRGVFQANEFEVGALDPLGVFAFNRRIPAEGELVVFPLPQAFKKTALSGSERFGWQEFTSRLLRGSSVDPDGVRPYVPGDPMRRIHWRQTARNGKLSVIEFEESQATNLVIALDLQKGTEIGDAGETTLEYGVRLAASLAQETIEYGASVRLMAANVPDTEISSDDSKIHFAASRDGRGQSHLFLILNALARVKADSAVSMRELLKDNFAGITAGTTILIITSNPDEELYDALGPILTVGVKVGVAYVDPTTFHHGHSKKAVLQNERFFASLAPLRLPTFLIRSTPDSSLNPEDISNIMPEATLDASVEIPPVEKTRLQTVTVANSVEREVGVRN